MEKQKNTKKSTIILSVLLTIFIAAIGVGLGLLISIIRSAPDAATLELRPTTSYTSFIYDANGVEIQRLSAGENRVYATLDEIPLHLQHAVIAVEDERFYQHKGIDIRGIFRAVFNNIKSGLSGNGFTSQGASTLTQQLVKNNILTPDKSISRKIQEQYLALQFEKIYDKDTLLEYYLNTMALGQGTNGVQAAAHRYFDKDVSELTLTESVVIAGITQYPTKYDPIRNPEANWEKAQIILNKMLEQGYITQSEYEQALEEDVYENIKSVNAKNDTTSHYTYFVDTVIEEVLNDLEQQGMSRAQANQLLFSGGINIYTTFDSSMQQAVDRHMADDSIFPDDTNELVLSYSVSIENEEGSHSHLYREGTVDSENEIEAFKISAREDMGIDESTKIIAENLIKVPQPQAAFVVMDHNNGHVKALSGGRGDKVSRDFNRVTAAKRQPGSTFKLLGVYAPAMEEGLISPGTLVMDEPYTIDLPSGPYSPKNWNNSYKGLTTIREAIWDSMNVIAVKTLEQVGIDVAFEYLEAFGFSSLLESDKGYSMALGGLTEGVTPLELNAAYGAIANGGMYIEPVFYTRVTDQNGNVLLEKVPQSNQVISGSTAYMLTNMMEDVINIGTGKALNTWFTGMPVAGKTGTTNGNKDILFSGYTPYYTATVWMGHDQPKALQGTRREHLELWGRIMADIHEDLDYRAFDIDDTGYTYVARCSASNMLATDQCSTVVEDYFQHAHIINEKCDIHNKVNDNNNSNNNNNNNSNNNNGNSNNGNGNNSNNNNGNGNNGNGNSNNGNGNNNKNNKNKNKAVYEMMIHFKLI